MQLELNYEPTCANASRFAEDIVGIAREQAGVELDYSVDSLAVVDEIVESFRDGQDDVEEMADILFGIGCYVGEVLVRRAGGQWLDAAATPMAEIAGFFIVVKVGRKLCNPIAKVFKRYTGGIEHNLRHFYDVFTDQTESGA